MRVLCLADPQHRRARKVAEFMFEGLRRHGVDARIQVPGAPKDGDVAVAYGWRNEGVFKAWRAAGKHFLYVDLGYWDRKPPGRVYDGYYKVSADAWCPLEKMRRNCPPDRFNRLGVTPKPWHSGELVIVAGMSERSAAHHGLRAEAWEQGAIRVLRRYTSLPIVYRPKPSWLEAAPLQGAGFSRGDELAPLLERTHFLATHHSNAAVDALVAGVPVFCEKSVASTLSAKEFWEVSQPVFPSDQARAQLLADVAYVQWNGDEMRSGECWENVRGLIQ